MGHKSVLLTLNQKNQFLNLSNFNSKSFLFLYFFYNNFRNLLLKKNIYISKFFFNVATNKIYLNANVFFGASFLRKFSKKKIKKTLKRTKNLKTNFNSSAQNNLLLDLKKDLFTKLFKNFNLTLKTNFVVFNFTLINKKFNYKVISFLLSKVNRFRRPLFDKKIPLLKDFVRMLSLYGRSLVTLETLGSLFGLVFSGVYKRNHNKFFLFLQLIFSLFIRGLDHLDPHFKLFKGIKFTIKGRLSGDAKASTRCLKFGSVPTQSVVKNVDFIKINSYTSSLGVFGLKFWVYKSSSK